MKRMRLLVALVGLLSLVPGVPETRAREETATIAQVMEAIRSRRRATDFKTEGRLVRLDAAGRRTTSQFRMKVRSFPGTVKVLWEVTDPPADRLRLLVESRETGELLMRLARERGARVEVVPPEDAGGALLDSSLSYEDLADAHFSWRDQRLVGEETCAGDRGCYVISSQPDSGTDSHYAAVTSWIDKGIYFPLVVRKRVRGSSIVKEFTYRGLRQSKGQWGARQIDVRVEGSPLRTLIVVTGGSGKAGLGAEDFDPRVLAGAWR